MSMYFLYIFLKKRCTNSRFDTIFNKTQFCYDTEIAAKSSRTQKKGRKSKELMMLLQYIIQNCWGFRKQNLRKKLAFSYLWDESPVQNTILKFSFSEKTTKFRSYPQCYLPIVYLVNQLICQNSCKITAKFCGLLRKAEL